MTPASSLPSAQVSPPSSPTVQQPSATAVKEVSAVKHTPEATDYLALTRRILEKRSVSFLEPSTIESHIASFDRELNAAGQTGCDDDFLKTVSSYFDNATEYKKDGVAYLCCKYISENPDRFHLISKLSCSVLARGLDQVAAQNHLQIALNDTLMRSRASYCRNLQEWNAFISCHQLMPAIVEGLIIRVSGWNPGKAVVNLLFHKEKLTPDDLKKLSTKHGCFKPFIAEDSLAGKIYAQELIKFLHGGDSGSTPSPEYFYACSHSRSVFFDDKSMKG